MPLNDRQNLIIHTMVMRLSIKNSLEYLQSHGYKIALSTYKKDKSIITKNSEKRKFELIRTGLWEQHIERINQIETSLKLAWENYHQEKSPFNKVKILSIITAMQPLLSQYYSASQSIIENDTELKKLFAR